MPDVDDKFKSRVSFTLLAITAIALAIGLVWIAACGALAVAALRLSQWNTLLAVPVHATFGAQYRADGLLIGCLAALILPRYSVLFRPWHAWLLLAAFGGCISHYTNLIPLWESVTIAPLIHATSLFGNSILGVLLNWNPLASIGLISYSLYIWQQPLLLIPISGAIDFALRIAVLTGMATLSYHLLEKPLIRFGKNLTRGANVLDNSAHLHAEQPRS